MKYLLALILSLSLFSCARAPSILSRFSMAKPAPVLASIIVGKLTFENFAPNTYYDYVKGTVSFPKGRYPDEASLFGVTEDGEIVDWLPIKWHLENGNKHSIALAQAIFKAKLAGNSRRTISIYTKQKPFPPFTFGTELNKFLISGLINQQIGMSYTAPGGTPCYADMGGSYAVLQTSKLRTVIRMRNHPICAGVPNKNISFTYYFELLSGANHGDFYVVVGNDTLEAPVPGGLQVESVDLLVKSPFEMGIFYPSGWAFSGTSQIMGYNAFRLLTNKTIADGQTFAFKGRWGVFSPNSQFEREMFLIAANQSPLLGVYGTEPLDRARASKAYGPTGVIAKARGTEDQMRSAVSYKCSINRNAQPEGYLGEINLNPPSTGAQPDFMSGIPVFDLQTLHAQSVCPLRDAMIAVLKESWRPSYMWWNPSPGIERRVDMADWPELFFWSSKIHYDWSWNNNKGADIWRNRLAPFQDGPRTGSWAPYDNQHFGFSSVRGLYELTGDVYLADIIKFNQTIEYWNFFTGRNSGNRGYFFATEADRASGRIGKEVTQSFEYFPDDNLLKTAMVDKTSLVYKPVVQNNKSTVNVSYLVDTYPDPRLVISMNCMNGDYISQGIQPTAENCRLVVSWQTPFFLENLALQIKNGQNKRDSYTLGAMFMDELPTYLDTSNGYPVTTFLRSLPSARNFGSIGVWWWAGWLNLAKHYPNHPNQALIAKLRTHIDQAIQTAGVVDTYWRANDSWLSYE